MSDLPSSQPEQTLPPRSRRPFVLFFLFVLLIAASWVGYRYAKLHLALANARREVTGGQFMRAEFWAGRALGVDANNVAALRLMAELNEAQDKPVALAWRIRIAQLQPGNGDDTIAWAKCALRFDQREMAVNALENLPQDFKNRSAEYHETMAGCTLAAHQVSLAEEHFMRAVELDRDNPVYRVNLAAFRLNNSASPEARAAAAVELEGAVDDSRVSLFAVRALFADAIRRQDGVKARSLGEKLHVLPGHTFNDDLGCLEFLISTPDFPSALGKIEIRAESDVQLASQTADWLNSHSMPVETLRWLGQAPQATQANPRVQMAKSDAYLALHDWTGLQTFLGECQWGQSEFLKTAMLIRCKRERSEPWEKEWKQLLAGVKAHPPDGLLLAHLVIGWGWRTETLDLLWAASEKPETESRALEYLWDIYSTMGETRDLLRVARAQTDSDPANPVKKNNEAFLTLLLHGASDRAERLAKEASATDPKNPEWASTYAYALHLTGKDTEARKVMENLPPGTLARPGIALYYAIVLDATGDRDKAKEFLTKLNPNGMLPEERKLAENLALRLNPTGP